MGLSLQGMVSRSLPTAPRPWFPWFCCPWAQISLYPLVSKPHFLSLVAWSPSFYVCVFFWERDAEICPLLKCP